MIERSIEYPIATWGGADIEFRPFIPVTVMYGQRKQRLNGLVDSGSTTSYVDIGFAEVLGIDLSNSEQIITGGLGGEGESGHIVSVQLLIDEFEFEYQTHVVFTKLHSQIMLLGQRDFFQHFNVHFQTKYGKFVVTKVPTIDI